MNRDGKRDFRYQMVRFALGNTVKATAREYKTSPGVVRKWIRRYHDKRIAGLEDESRQPHYSPNKCSEEFEKKVIRLRLETKHRYGARKLIERFGLRYGKSCVQRIITKNELKRMKKTKLKQRRSLWSIKRLTRVFEKIQVDVKVLRDIPQYWNVYRREKMPGYEFTARDVKTGASFVCYAYANNSTNAATFLVYLLSHLKACAFDVKQMTFQMDNGAEFFACGQKKKGKTPVEKVIEDIFKAKIGRIPPASPTFNSDVETFHRLVEDEFYDVEDIQDEADLQAKMATYLLDFNFLRKNSYKDNKTPYTLAREDVPDLACSAFSVAPIVLDDNQHLYFNVLNKKNVFLTPFVSPVVSQDEELIFDTWEQWGINPNDFSPHFHKQGGNNVSGLDTFFFLSKV